MSQVILIRHGETDYNTRGLFQGISDNPLNIKGKDQARLIAQKLAFIIGTKSVSILSSPLLRAHETASIIAKEIGIKKDDIEVVPALREMDFGLFEGQEKKHIKKRFPGFYADDEKPSYPGYETPFPEGESLKDSYERIQKFADTFKSSKTDEIYIILAHGGLNRMLRSHLLDLNPRKCFEVEHKHTEIRVFDTATREEKVINVQDSEDLGMTDNTEMSEEAAQNLVATIVDHNYPKDLSVGKQTGGLFNHVLRVEDGKTGRTWFLKQYLDKNVSAVFSPPKIPKESRADLAFKVHDMARDFAAAATLGSVSVPVVKKEGEVLVIDGIQNPRELIHDFVEGRPTSQNLGDVGTVLGGLHQETFEKDRYTKDPLFQNTEFRDFKLTLQYYNIADQSSLTPTESQAVRSLCDVYKTQAHCVLHGDINSRNIILSESADSQGGVIDFEQSHVGHPAYDLSYILCESFISGMYHGSSAKMAEGIKQCLESHSRVFDWDQLPDMEEEFGKHLALQAVYRFLGPSRASWTHYIEESKKAPIIEFCLKMLTDDGARQDVVTNLMSDNPELPFLNFTDHPHSSRFDL